MLNDPEKIDIDQNIVEGLNFTDQRIQELNGKLEESSQKNLELSSKLDNTRDDYNKIISSRIWRISRSFKLCSGYFQNVIKSNIFSKLILSIRRRGFKNTFKSIIARFRKIEGYKISQDEFDKQRNTKFECDIKISILVPLYNTPTNFLKDMINSVVNQTYTNWELCLADGSDNEHEVVGNICENYQKSDSRIAYRKLSKNEGISENTNRCIEMSTGDYIGLFDHDDILHPAALYEVMKAISEENADFIYTDEVTFKDKITNITATHFKPEFAIDNLRANNYICHFSVFSRELMEKSGMFRKKYDGSQDHDYILRLTENANKIIHIPKVLYFWRNHKGSVAGNINSKTYAFEAGRSAVENHLNRLGLKAIVENSKIFPAIYRIKYEIIDEPLISIIIYNNSDTEQLHKCLKSIIDRLSYKNYEIIVATQKNIDINHALFKNTNIKIIKSYSLSYPKANNLCVQHAKGKHILFLNGSSEIISTDLLQEMLMYSQRSDVGAVGAKIYNYNNTIQHAGIVFDIENDDLVRCQFKNLKKTDFGYIGRLFYAFNISAVSSKCMMMPRDVFTKVSGFDERFCESLFDVDICMQVRKEGYNIVWTPYAELYNYEKKQVKKNIIDSNSDKTLFKQKWEEELKAGDPYNNKNICL